MWRFNSILDGKASSGSGAGKPAAGRYEEERNYIGQALEAGLDGSQEEALAGEAARYVGRAYGVPLSSGAAALQLALKLAGERLYGCAGCSAFPGGPARGALSGKRVFCPDFAALESVAPVIYEGGEPVFIDCGEADWSMDPQALELAFEKYPDVKIVIMTHAYGYPGEVLEIRRICREHGALLIEDCSESLGAEVWTGQREPGTENGWKGEQGTACGPGQVRPEAESSLQEAGAWSSRRGCIVSEAFWQKAGSFGDYAVLDFGPGRIITGGSGGMLLTDDRYSAEKALYWAGGARAAAPWGQHEELGYSFRMGDLAAAAVRGQLVHLAEIMERKRAIYEGYAGRLEADLAAMIPIGEGTRPNYWRSCMTVESSIGFRETRGEREYTYVSRHGTAAPMEILEALDEFCGTAGRGRGRGAWRGSAPGRNPVSGKSSPLYKPLSLQPLFRNCEAVTRDGCRWSYRHFYEDDYRVRCHRAREYFESGLCLPDDVGMTKEEQDQVSEVILGCYSMVDAEKDGGVSD